MTERRIWRYIVPSEAWYASLAVERGGSVAFEVSMGVDPPDGGTHGEWMVKWYDFSSTHGQPKGTQPLSLRLEVFTDGLECLAETGLVAALTEHAIAHKEGIEYHDLQPDEFIALIKRLGFQDCTPRKYEDSYPDRPMCTSKSGVYRHYCVRPAGHEGKHMDGRDHFWTNRMKP